MSITDELREYVGNFYLFRYKDVREKLNEIADRIDAEHKKACDDAWDNGYEADYLGIEKWLTEHPQVMEHHGWVRLPLDADGVSIHVGDVMEWRYDNGEFEVIGIGGNTLFYIDKDSGECEWTAAGDKHHHHATTVDDVLREFGKRWDDHAHYAKGELVETFAEKLRLAESE